jgi:SAM-dependent methyltransferase
METEDNNVDVGTKSYQTKAGSDSYLDYIASDDASVFMPVLTDAVVTRLGDNKEAAILDGGCGPGWLAGHLAATGRTNVYGCDTSAPLIEAAKERYPDAKFEVADMTKPMPYGENFFDYIVLSMSVVALDLEKQKEVFRGMYKALKPGGHLIFITVNPYYGYPVGIWKRGWLRYLLRKTPLLKLRPYQEYVRAKDRSFVWNNNLISYFYTLDEQTNAILDIGYQLTNLLEIASDTDSDHYNLRHRLYRYPIFLQLDFKKPSQS